jgi:hypothetical protein
MRLHAGALHIWQANLDADCPQIEGLLDEAELERAARIVREHARRRWIVARGRLRMLLGAYLDEHPRALRFTSQANGKPELDLAGDTTLHFNLSHSGGIAVYALTEMCAVGIDVELIDRQPGATPHSLDLLRAWVVREALAKRLGLGVRNVTPPAQTASSEPWIAELDLRSGAVGAVAMAAAPVDFRVYAIDFCRPGSILQEGVGAHGHSKPNVSTQLAAGHSTVARKRSVTP